MTKELQNKVDDIIKALPWWEESKDITCKGMTAKTVLEDFGDSLAADADLVAELQAEARKEDFYEVRFRFFLIDNDIDVEEDEDLQSLIDHVVKLEGNDFFDRFYTDLDCDCYMASGKGFKTAYAECEWLSEYKAEASKLDDKLVYVNDCGTEPSTYHIIGCLR